MGLVEEVLRSHHIARMVAATFVENLRAPTSSNGEHLDESSLMKPSHVTCYAAFSSRPRLFPLRTTVFELAAIMKLHDFPMKTFM